MICIVTMHLSPLETRPRIHLITAANTWLMPPSSADQSSRLPYTPSDTLHFNRNMLTKGASGNAGDARIKMVGEVVLTGEWVPMYLLGGTETMVMGRNEEGNVSLQMLRMLKRKESLCYFDQDA